MKFGLERMNAVMSSLGNPHLKFPAVHIAGTNGKGSVTAMIASVLRETGLSVGMYTSPHLEIYNERFQINGQLISSAQLNSLTRRVLRATASVYGDPLHLTQFEFLTAVAFLWFADRRVDVAVVETGLGGRLDATNVLRRVYASVITNIDLDHTDWLGSTREKIAFEKAGIIKPRVPVVTGASGGALAVIRRVARANGSLFISVPPASKRPRQSAPSLAGRHQYHNAALALAALKALGARLKISPRAIRRGFARVRWPGRFETFSVATSAGKRLVILDGAHNPAAVDTLVRTLKDKRLLNVDLLFGALRDKDSRGMIHRLQPVVRRCITVPLDSSRSSDPKKLARLAEWRGKAKAAESLRSGLGGILERAGGPVLVCGSLYLVGAVRSALRKTQKIT